MALTKAVLAEMLHEKRGLNGREAKDMVDQFFEEIRSTLAAGEDVLLSKFGHFKVRNKPQRPGRNPRTLEPVAITARRVVTFHPSGSIKNAVEKTQRQRDLTTKSKAPL